MCGIPRELLDHIPLLRSLQNLCWSKVYKHLVPNGTERWIAADRFRGRKTLNLGPL